jgi:hypothetical protein
MDFSVILDRKYLLDNIKLVMEVRIPEKVRHFLKNWKTISFSTKKKLCLMTPFSREYYRLNILNLYNLGKKKVILIKHSIIIKF